MVNINAQDRRIQYTGNGTAGPFSFSFQVNATSEIKVYVDTTVKTITTHYTVSLSSDGSGSISFTTGNHPTSSQTITIMSNIAISRTSQFTTGGTLTADALETEFNNQFMHHQQHDQRLDRALLVPEHDTILGADFTLPAKNSRLGKLLGFNSSTGNPEASFTVADGNTLAGISGDIATLADIEDGTDATNAIQTVAGIQANVTTVAGISSNVTTVAGLSSAIGTVNSNASSINTVSSAITNVNTVAGAITNINTVASANSNISTVASANSNIGTVASAIANVNTVASNVSGVNSFAERYRVASSEPSSSLDVGDLLFDTTANALKVYKSGGWEVASAFGNLSADGTPELGGDLDVLTHSIVSSSNRNISLTPNGSGVVRLDGNVDISTGAIDLKNGGTQSYIRFYCESSNAHYAQLQAPAHSDFGGNITLTMPATTGTLALTSQIPTVPSSGIASGNVATFTSGVADDDFLRVSGTSIEGRSASELASDIGATTTDEATALAIALG